MGWPERVIMKILNLYSGLGGNRKLWPKDTFITAVEINPDLAKVYSQLYPKDRVIVSDAHTYLMQNVEKFDFIWSSPPCQTHSRMAKVNNYRVYPDLKLYEEILFLQHWCKAPWIVENVSPYYRPLIHAEQRGRHLFWSNMYIPQFNVEEKSLMYLSRQELEEYIGISFEGNIYLKSHDPLQVLRNCVKPELGLKVFECVSGYV